MSLTVTTWNVENFSSGVSNFSDKRDHLASVLGQIEPDIVALQEIMDQQSIDSLGQKLGYHPVTAHPDGRGIRVGFLIRSGAPSSTAEITDWRMPANVLVQSLDDHKAVVSIPRLPRPALVVTLRHQGKEISFITLHLKSKVLTFPGGYFSTTDESVRASVAYFALQRRAAEARTIRENVTDLLSGGKDVIVLGDFNDGPDAATTQIFYGPAGSQPIGPQDAQNKNGAFQKADNDDPKRLFNVANLLPPELRWSRIYNGQEELLDHILVSEGMMPRAGGLRQVPAVEIRNADSPNLGNQPRDNSIVPDHAPATAVFSI